MGNIPGVMLGALLLYFVTFYFLPQLPEMTTNIANAVGLSAITQPSGDFPGIGEFMSRLKFLVFGLILVVVMLVRPEGLVPSRERQQELKKGTHDDTVIEDVNAEVS
jgi:branched-chain amino acid transport system permease protein